jgi:hypothetical protein
VNEDAQPVSYEGAPLGVPMLTSTGSQFGTLEKVLELPSEDLFDGVIVSTEHGRRFVDRDQIAEITTEYIRCAIDDAAAAALPEPSGTPAFEADAGYGEGSSFREWSIARSATEDGAPRTTPSSRTAEPSTRVHAWRSRCRTWSDGTASTRRRSGRPSVRWSCRSCKGPDDRWRVALEHIA